MNPSRLKLLNGSPSLLSAVAQGTILLIAISVFNVSPTWAAPPRVPVHVSPLTNADINADATVNFTWLNSASADSYEFHFFNNAPDGPAGPHGEHAPFITGLLSQEICSAGICTYPMAVDLPVFKEHAWRIRAHNADGSSEWSRSTFNVVEPVTDPPPSPEPLSPLTGANLEVGDSPYFRWTPTESATLYEVRIENDDERSFTGYTAIVGAGSCSETICGVQIELNFPLSDTYLWTVNASNAAGRTDSDALAFSLIEAATQLPDTPENQSPQAGEQLVLQEVQEFQWSPDPNAVSYEFHLFDGNLRSTTPIITDLQAEDICDEVICTLSQTVNLPIGLAHAWRVRGLNSLGYSEWSRSLFSTTDIPPDNTPATEPDTPAKPDTPVENATSITPTEPEFPIDTETPSTPLAISPTENAVLSAGSSVSFQWQPVASATGYDFYITNAVNDALTLVSDLQSSDVCNETVCSYELVIDLPVSTSHSWHVRAIQHEVASPWSEQVFETIAETGSNGEDTGITTPSDPATVVSANNASRLLAQASFGPTRNSVKQVQSMGIEDWIDHQFTLQGPQHLNYVRQFSNGSNRLARHEVWWRDVVEGEDQLRQRVAFALSQILVVSDTGYDVANSQYGATHYYDILRNNAFGNYRELLEQITLNPIMGLYLSMLQNARGESFPDASTRADENYAREVLQLFSIGLHELNIDGTTDGTPTFNQNQIESFARAFTGWNYADAGNWNRPLFTGADQISPMQPFEEFHDTDAKELLNGAVAPAGLSAREDLEFALDNIFNHPNIGPFIGKQLIMRLVTSNPSPAYVERVATVFNNNGEDVKGDLQAVVRAILLDTEARNPPLDEHFGKLREPILRISHLWRAFNVHPGNTSNRGAYNTTSPEMHNLDIVTGQAVLKSASVFNFFIPSFAPAGPVTDQNLVAPEFEIFTESNELATSNRIGQQIQYNYRGNSQTNGQRVSYLDFSFEVELAQDTEALLEHLDTLLLSGNLSDSLADTLRAHLNTLPATADGRSQRVRDAVTLIMASPDYLVQM